VADAYEAIERASRDELAALQLERLKWSVRHAYDHVRHYRDAFAAAGVHPDDLQTLGDLRRFPFTTKDDLRDSYPDGLFAVPREQVVRIHASSGTTGKPTVVGYSRRDLDTWSGLVARSIWAAGGRPGDCVHVAYGYGLFTGGLGAHYGAERLGCTVVPVSGGMTERQVLLIADLRPAVIMVTPSYMLAILDEFERQGLDPSVSSLRVGMFGAEPWTDGMREEIERRAAIDAVDIYGLSEVMGPGVASECVETKDGLVVWEDHFYPEIVDPTSGEPVADGERGELVFTTLTKEALPVIRYRTRDLTRLLPGTAHDAPSGAGDGPKRRHDDRPGRQRLPDADRGADPARRARAALPARPLTAGPARRADRPRRGAAGRRLRGGAPRSRRRARRARQGACGGHGRRRRRRAGAARAISRQGRSHRRPPLT
jgi:phenylacetate-CoA ligase